MKIHNKDKVENHCLSKPSLTGTRVPSSRLSSMSRLPSNETRLPSNETRFPLNQLRTPNTAPEKLQAPPICLQQPYSTPYIATFQSPVIPAHQPTTENMQKMFGIMPPSGASGILSSNIYTKLEHQDPLFLHNQHFHQSHQSHQMCTI